MDVSIGRLQKFSGEAGDASGHLLALKAFRSLLSHLQKASRELRASADLRCEPVVALPYRTSCVAPPCALPVRPSGLPLCTLNRFHRRRRVAECCTHSIPHLLSPPLQSSLAPAVGETADFAGIFPHAIPEDAGRLLAVHVGDKRATGGCMLTLPVQLSTLRAVEPPHGKRLTQRPTDAVAEDAARALLALLAPAWGGLGVWGPSAVRRCLELVVETSSRASLLEAVEAWANGGASAVHRLRLANALATTGAAALSTVLSQLPDAAARCAGHVHSSCGSLSCSDGMRIACC